MFAQAQRLSLSGKAYQSDPFKTKVSASGAHPRTESSAPLVSSWIMQELASTRVTILIASFWLVTAFNDDLA